MFEDVEINIPCPGCGQKTKKSVAWLKANKQFTCDGCSNAVTVDAEKLFAGIKKADKTLADFRKKLARREKR
ncbi:hypothetical protein LPU83_pLPU83a_0073 (plasmid) [Rhizobium favelukesii]|uniref:Uncharacterized protein n=1 Tax=Rhizobium favelukesii TaxID=348824 RepID=W6RGF2_9HYPH|nr:hypothetical protein LPU83_pLPU83a_0073 [Rhizobium favelukesii]